MSESKIEDLVYMSGEIGRRVEYVQGGGGNTSVKFSDHRMAIKASGELLKDLDPHTGYSIVDYKKITSYLHNPSSDKDVFSRDINSFVVETRSRPSMETGFHAILGSHVIHTHSIFANLLTCSKQGRKLAHKLFPEMIWVSYATPGYELTMAIRKEVAARGKEVATIFLENHGLIVSGNSVGETLERHSEINQAIVDHFRLPQVILGDYAKALSPDFIKENILFPDLVVYALAGTEVQETQAAKETLMAYLFLLETMKQKDLTPNFLSLERTRVLLEMESEKYRQKAIVK